MKRLAISTLSGSSEFVLSQHNLIKLINGSLTIYITVLAIGWQKWFLYIDSRKSWITNFLNITILSIRKTYKHDVEMITQM